MKTTAAVTTRVFARWIALAAATLLLSGCGFHLRGHASLPFSSLYVAGVENTPFGTELTRVLRASSTTRITDRPDQAEAVLKITSVSSEKTIQSLSGTGKVREFQLRYVVAFHVHDGKGNFWLPPSEISLKRDVSFNDTQVLAKENEEALLYRDMQSDAVQQIVRRLRAAQVKRAG